MKVQLLSICFALIAVSICGVGYAQSNPAVMQPGVTFGPQASPKITAPSIGQAVTMTPACPTCSGMAYIPGNPTTTLTATTCTPCPTPGCPTGAGPSETLVTCGSCNPCPCPPNTCNTCPPASCASANCDPCGRKAPSQTTCTSYSVQASAGGGPCALCPPIATVSACTQATVNCLQSLSGADADRAYLQAMIQLNQPVLALSDASADHLSITSLQDFATNTIADSRGHIAQAEKWLRTKYCVMVTSCVPALGGLSICDNERPGKAFDDAYKTQIIQYYVDEIALSQVEVERGLDSQVKAAAAKTIRDDQLKISRLTRCGRCEI